MSDFDDIDSEDFLIIDQGRWRSTFEDDSDVFFLYFVILVSFVDKEKALCYNLKSLKRNKRVS